jgi:hypothetical protein
MSKLNNKVAVVTGVYDDSSWSRARRRSRKRGAYSASRVPSPGHAPHVSMCSYSLSAHRRQLPPQSWQEANVSPSTNSIQPNPAAAIRSKINNPAGKC